MNETSLNKSPSTYTDTLDWTDWTRYIESPSTYTDALDWAKYIESQPTTKIFGRTAVKNTIEEPKSYG